MRSNVGVDRRTRSECAKRKGARVRPCRTTCYPSREQDSSSMVSRQVRMDRVIEFGQRMTRLS